jgi:hypothetical protein
MCASGSNAAAVALDAGQRLAPPLNAKWQAPK